MDQVSRKCAVPSRRWALRRSLATECDGGEISEVDHAFQVATRGERAGADEELVVGTHRLGKARQRVLDEARSCPEESPQLAAWGERAPHAPPARAAGPGSASPLTLPPGCLQGAVDSYAPA